MYFGRCIKSMIEFKSKIDPTRFLLPPVELTTAQVAIYEEVLFVVKAAVETHMRTTITEITLDNVRAMLTEIGSMDRSTKTQLYFIEKSRIQL
jgi:hypothetical protein